MEWGKGHVWAFPRVSPCYLPQNHILTSTAQAENKMHCLKPEGKTLSLIQLLSLFPDPVCLKTDPSTVR